MIPLNKGEDQNVQNKSQITRAYSKACIGVAVVPPVFCTHVCVARDEKLAHVHVTFFRRPMQWGLFTAKKTSIKPFQKKSQITNAYSNACIGVAVVLAAFCIYVCVGREEKLAHVHVIIFRRQMQWGPLAAARMAFCIYICVGREEKLAHVQVTICRRPVQWGPISEKKTRIKPCKTNPKFRTHDQITAWGWLSYWKRFDAFTSALDATRNWHTST